MAAKPPTVIVEGIALRFPELQDMQISYDAGQDMLSFSVGNPVPAVSYDFNGDIWVRVAQETGQVVGVEFENFERGFLVRHPEMAEAWKTARRHRRSFRVKLGRQESFSEMLLRWLRTYMSGLPSHDPAHA